MGNSIVVDSEVSNLPDILNISRSAYSREKDNFTPDVQFADGVHARLWRHFRDINDRNMTEPVNLMSFEFQFVEQECYTMLLMSQGKLEKYPTNVIEFLECVSVSRKESYQVFTCNGKRSSNLLKAYSLTKTFELDDHLGVPGAVEFLLNGGFLRGRKLAKTRKQDYALPVTIVAMDQPDYGLFRERFINTDAPISAPMRTQSPSKPKLNFAGLGLKTREDEFNELMATNKENMSEIDTNLDIRDTTRGKIKMSHFSTICSEVYPNLYVGGVIVAKDYALLKEHGITHVINCAGDVCRNYHPEHLLYQTFFLKDSKIENIECLFYPTLEYIEEAISSGGKVFVHCMQGVSRSVTICLSYIMMKERIPFDQAHTDIKARRGICSPNVGFTVQLIQWHKRLTGQLSGVKTFAISSHQVEQPHTIVARLVDTTTFDPRGVYVIVGPTTTYVWKGSQLWEHNADRYLDIAYQHIKRIQIYEGAPEAIVEVLEGQEPAELLELVPITTNVQSEFDSWYPKLDKVVDMEPQSFRDNRIDEDRTNEPPRPKLYVYPDVEGEVIFDFEEMTETSLLVLCHETNCYVWKGEAFEAGDVQEEEFIGQV